MNNCSHDAQGSAQPPDHIITPGCVVQPTAEVDANETSDLMTVV